jgi:hypothetical protein
MGWCGLKAAADADLYFYYWGERACRYVFCECRSNSTFRFDMSKKSCCLKGLGEFGKNDAGMKIYLKG